ncbi:RNA-binding protein, partial [Aphelenchoides avenae]
CVKLVVYNLSLNVTRKQILELVQPYGRVRESERFQYKREEFAIAFVHLECSADDLRSAICDLRGKRVGRFRISVRVSIPPGEQHVLTVENVGADVSEDDLEEHFARIGELSYCEIMYDRHADERLGHAAISFYTRAQAAEAIRRMTGTELRGRQILVRWLKSEDRRAPSSQWYGVTLHLVPFGMGVKQLRALFSKCGPVREVDLERRLETGARRARIWFFRRADALRAVCRLDGRQCATIQLRLRALSEVEQVVKRQSAYKSDLCASKLRLYSSQRTTEFDAPEPAQEQLTLSSKQVAKEQLFEEPFKFDTHADSGSAGFEEAFGESVGDSSPKSDEQSIECLPEGRGLMVPPSVFVRYEPKSHTRAQSGFRALSPIIEIEGSSDAEDEAILASAIRTEAGLNEPAPTGSKNLIDLETLAAIDDFFEGKCSRSSVDQAAGVDLNNNAIEDTLGKSRPACTSFPPKAVQQEAADVLEPCAIVYAHQMDKLMGTSRRTLEHRFYDIPPRRRPFALVDVLRDVAGTHIASNNYFHAADLGLKEAPARTLVLVGSADESQWLQGYLIASGLPSKPWNWCASTTSVTNLHERSFRDNWWKDGVQPGAVYVSEPAEMPESVFVALDHIVSMYTSANLEELHLAARCSAAERCTRPLLMTTFVDARDLHELSVAENLVKHVRL